MNSVITNVSINEDITLVSLKNIPGTIDFISDLFKSLADNKINVDMITMSASQGADVIISFTAQDNSLTDILSVTGRYKASFPNLRTDINSGNFKVSFYGENMREIPGVASWLFSLFAAEGIDIKLISTSEVDVSCLFDRVSYEAVTELINSKLK